ncbi:MAG: hypothetical protein AAB911_01065 [Patescibacteria group bacterium]
MREDLFEAKDGFQVIRSGWRIVGMIFPDGTRINIGDKVVSKRNCIMEAGHEGEVVKLFWPHVSPRTTDVVYVRFNGNEFPWALKPGEFEVI